MSTLVVEVCTVSKVERHLHADRLAIATVKGWKVCIKFDPTTETAEFQPGDLCIYFPPDSILPEAIATDRLNIMKYLAPLPKDEDGTRPAGGRVKATRLRGEQSFGVIMKLEPGAGDDPNWQAGTDVREHFGVTKWEPPAVAVDGDSEPEHTHFHRYTDIEHWRNFPDVLKEGEEVIVTEKLHGKNCRVGLIREEDGSWVFAAGSHGLRRKQFTPRMRRFKLKELVERMILSEPNVEVGETIDMKSGELFRVDEVDLDTDEPTCRGTQVTKTGAEVMLSSEFWEPLTDNVRELLQHVRDVHPWPEFKQGKQGIVLFGEIVGRGVQKGMEYGLKERGFRAFDLAINGQYVDYDTRIRLLEQFNVPAVPILYRGPFSEAVVDTYTDGETTMAATDQLGKFKGREGVVITPVLERLDEQMMRTSTHGRVIFKSVSADYLARTDISDGH